MVSSSKSQDLAITKILGKKKNKKTEHKCHLLSKLNQMPIDINLCHDIVEYKTLMKFSALVFYLHLSQNCSNLTIYFSNLIETEDNQNHNQQLLVKKFLLKL